MKTDCGAGQGWGGSVYNSLLLLAPKLVRQQREVQKWKIGEELSAGSLEPGESLCHGTLWCRESHGRGLQVCRAVVSLRASCLPGFKPPLPPTPRTSRPPSRL